MDAADARVRRRLEQILRYEEGGAEWQEGIQLTLISPARFARFAAREIAASL
jgi:hypothetical protein